ncbi:DNA ligase, partial [Acinetobacter baumannii]|nr:DNA ligase [Acinetobacter baumannii]
NQNYSLYLPRMVEDCYRIDKTEADDLKRIEEQFKNAIEAAKKLAESEAVVVARAASVSSARPSTSFARSYSSSSTRAPTTTSFRSSPV